MGNAVVVGKFLFGNNVGVPCIAFTEDLSSSVDEAYFFNVVLQIFFASACLSVAQMIFFIIGLRKLGVLLNINGCLGLAVFIMANVVRFRYTGRVCAGDQVDNALLQPYYANLKGRGDFLISYIITVWVTLAVLCLIVAFIAIKRRRN